MSSLGDRIREAAETLGGLNKLAEVTGLPRRTLGDYVSGVSEPKSSALLSIARATDSDLNWLIRDDYRLYEVGLERGQSRLPGIVAGARQVRLPLYDVQASAGQGALVLSERVEEYLSVGRDWLRRNLPPWAPNNAMVGILEGSGDSMEPTIRDGDLIMVVQDVDLRAVERGGVFVFSLDHERLLLKRLQLLANGDLRIISDNPAYETETIPAAERETRVIVHGMVFFVGGKPRSI